MDSSIKRGADHNLDFINILFEEWKFRLSQYWSITSKTVFISFILFFIPYMKDAWGANTLNLPNQIFPVIGILFSIITCLLSTIEMNKINRIKALSKALEKNNGGIYGRIRKPSEYHSSITKI